MGAHRRRWMPFRQPFLTAGKGIVENTSSCRIVCYFIDLYKTPPKCPRPAPSDGRPRVGLGRFIESTP
jgi:hypothetical protein